VSLGTSCEATAPLEPLDAAAASRRAPDSGVRRMAVRAHVYDDLALG
jgi:hypothetical protein